MSEPEAVPESGPQSEGKPQNKRRKKEATGAEDPLGALAQGLEDVLDGFHLLDREVRFDEAVRADLIGVDGSGRLVWVVVADDSDDRTALAVLDGMSFARRNPALLRRHFAAGVRGGGANKATRLVLVLPTERTNLAERFKPFTGRELEILTVRTITSGAGERSYLTPVGTGGEVSDLVPSQDRDAFLDALPEGQRGLARILVERMRRMDDELSFETSQAGVLWTYQGETLAQLEHRDTGLAGGVAPEFSPLRIATELDVERFLDAAVGRLVRLFSDDSQPARRDLGELAFGEGPLLTPEEIAAFRD